MKTKNKNNIKIINLKKVIAGVAVVDVDEPIKNVAVAAVTVKEEARAVAIVIIEVTIEAVVVRGQKVVAVVIEKAVVQQ